MASLSSQQQQELALSAAYEDDTPTPLGWRRKLIPHVGKGLVPARTDVIFIAPNGEEFKTKAQLQRYLKLNKGSPLVSEFIWITDETPRRSSRSASKRSKSPPKSVCEKKSAAEIPPEESKVIKLRRIEKEDAVVVETKSKHGKKAGKVVPIESTDGIDRAPSSSPPASNAQESKKKPIKGAKKKKGAQVRTQSTEVSSKAHISEDDMRAQMNEKHENGKEEAAEVRTQSTEVSSKAHISEDDMRAQMSEKHENGKEEEHGKEVTMKELTSHETHKEEVPMNTKNLEIEEQADYKGKDMDNAHDDKHMEDQEGSKDLDGDCDATTTSIFGSDLSAEGMEAESDICESEKKDKPLCEEEANHHAEKIEMTILPHDYEKDSMMHVDNHLIQEAK